MLVTNPAKRYTVDNVLNHPWLQDPDVIVRYDAMCGFLCTSNSKKKKKKKFFFS